MTASQCLNHPWLNKSIAPTPETLPNEKVINTKNLRRFVIRRRWQVIVFFLNLNINKLFNSFIF